MSIFQRSANSAQEVFNRVLSNPDVYGVVAVLGDFNCKVYAKVDTYSNGVAAVDKAMKGAEIGQALLPVQPDYVKPVQPEEDIKRKIICQTNRTDKGPQGYDQIYFDSRLRGIANHRDPFYTLEASTALCNITMMHSIRFCCSR